MHLTTAAALIVSVFLFGRVAAYPNLNGTSSRIVGGQAVSIQAYPYQVVIYNLATGGSICGGSILDTSTILTAAHCITVADPSAYVVGAGSTYLSSATSLSQNCLVARAIPHPGYNPVTFDNDIAILKLDSPLWFNAAIAPIALPPAGFIPKIGARATASGWGSTVEGGGTSDVLRAVVLALTAHTKCAEVHGPDITTRQFCATAAGKDTCQGDSGGPLALPSPITGTRMVIGVTSYGQGCARPGFPGVYTRVSAYRPWIKSVGGI